jgi:hypothetical protein
MADEDGGLRLDAREERYISEAAALTFEQLRAAKALMEKAMPGDIRLVDGGLLGSVVQSLAINYQSVRRK